ncbi:glutaminase A [Paroceanicella profunda]|uniref:Glutaminase n=1 Tax=Paroceanicella profunda TaxID=2579971 RepID=A0A5B8FGN3_9RHOB|nr:glutaminase A [Paroceanicella profunda]QDL91441.1 glutaminase A [Paroceanicella profunda]
MSRDADALTRRAALLGASAAALVAGAGLPAAAAPRDIGAAVRAALAAARAVTGGRNADYIPYLADVPPELCGVAVVTADGTVDTAGDTGYGFAIESISKVMTLALVMEEIGPEAVRDRIGADPTGLPFNSVIALELHDGKPLSPLVNAGAIATASLVPGATAEEKWRRILAFQSKMAGTGIRLSQEVNRSEQTTNFHNCAIAWLLFSAGALEGDPLVALDVYTRQCSTLVTCSDLAMMGATLANGGVNPATGERVIRAQNVPHILAEMMMEGLYTASGDFAFTVGLPGKSGVGGGIMAVAPGDLAIATFSPPLDDAGNSVRGLVAIAELAKSLNLNIFRG